MFHGANNHPLRGNKATLWEGGVKGVAFASGGVVKEGGRTSDGESYSQLRTPLDGVF